MPTRTARAQWEGPVTDGDGTVAPGGGAFRSPYSWRSRFEQGTGTNPEELIAAAHAGCFSMALAAALQRAPRRCCKSLGDNELLDEWFVAQSGVAYELAPVAGS